MAKWTRNHVLEIGSVVLVVGLVLTILSFTDNWVHPAPAWLTWYHNLTHPASVSGSANGDYNLIALIVGPILLIMGGFYVGEQVVLRRRFERMLDTPQKSEFAKRRRDLEDLAKRLPSNFEDKIEKKESEFKSKRSA